MYATTEGTRRFVDAQPEPRRDHYRQSADGLWLPSIGVGTYLGEATDADDTHYRSAFTRAWTMGCNIFDTAINYRHQHSERALGSWLHQAFDNGTLDRDEIILCTKGGFVPFDSVVPDDPRKWVYETYIASGIAHANDFAANYQHCIAPGFLEAMIDQSRSNLGVECIDVYYLHNPETQHISFSHQTFRARILDAFETLEDAVANGLIRSYGMATWAAFRSLPDAPDYLSLTEMVGLAAQVAGQDHHFRYVQLPYNLFMTEAFALENQQIGEEFTSAINAAEELGLTVMTSASLHQGRLATPIMAQLAEFLPDLESHAQMAIQFARSTPGVTTALVGMKQIDHVRDNLALLDIPPADGDDIRRMFKFGE
ncbi:MAG: aldo/keto reductase [Anaerolineae bacterium]|nr:aldo/keto reductase [Anaerolineae bacterium]